MSGNIKISFKEEKTALSSKLVVNISCSDDFFKAYYDKKAIFYGKRIKIINKNENYNANHFRILIGTHYHASDDERFTINKSGDSTQVIYLSKFCNAGLYRNKVLVALKLMSENLK